MLLRNNKQEILDTKVGNESNRFMKSVTFQTTHAGHDGFQSSVESYPLQALIDHKSKIVEGGSLFICKIKPPFHTNNSFLHILNIQIFLAIDENFHTTVGLENEAAKEVMHVPKWSCMRVIWTGEKMGKKLMGDEWSE